MTEEKAGARDLEAIETALLLEAVYRRYGLDFRLYSAGSMQRRVQVAVAKEGLATISALQGRLLRSQAAMDRFLANVSVRVTAMFRDPAFFRAFRSRVVGLLQTYPFVRIWVAGCSTGEEAYSLAILLEEEGLYERSRIYATDICSASLRSAQEAIFPLGKMGEYTANYQRAGGRGEFSRHYRARYDDAIFRRALRRNLVFAQHNLAADAAFNEFHVILCRNVMIYFNQVLQARVFEIFHESLCRLGVLALGNKESLRFSPVSRHYEEVDRSERLYRRVEG